MPNTNDSSSRQPEVKITKLSKPKSLEITPYPEVETEVEVEPQEIQDSNVEKAVSEEETLPTAEDLVKQTKIKFDNNNPVQSKQRQKTQRVEEKVSAENLVAEELKIAAREQDQIRAEKEKRHSFEEAENLFEKLKKTGTLREK